MKQASTWIRDCKRHHTRCNDGGNTPRKLPTRLVRVQLASLAGIKGIPNVRLEITDKNSKVEYLAFNHCWGKVIPFKLLESNYDACLKNIEFSELSKNMQDAARITANLGFSYL